MTTKNITKTLPNTTDDTSGCNSFINYLNNENISVNNSNAIKHYQCKEVDSYNATQEDLNYALECMATGGKNSQCAKDGESIYGCIYNLDYHDLLNDLDMEFTSSAYTFSSNSVVYKGIDSKVYYKKFQPHKLKEGDTIIINTFFSTSVSRDKASTYGNTLLIITGLNKVRCIIPPVTSILGAGSQTCEQEILLNRTFEMTITSIAGKNIYLTIN
jgi:hypothetical protein